MTDGKAYIDALFVDKGVKFINNKIEFWFNFDSKVESDSPSIFAGAATSLVFHNDDRKREFLDPVNAEVPFMYMFHDRYKRCMQIDKILLCHNNSLDIPINLSEASYKYHSHYRGNDMVSVVTLSCPFYSGDRNFRLKRIISLLDLYPCIIEDVSLIDDQNSIIETHDFSLSYCGHINSKDIPLKIGTHKKIQNGFMVSFDEVIPRNIYFFNSNTSIEMMPMDNPSFFSWTMSKSKRVVNIHSFARINIYTDEILNDFLCVNDILALEESL